MNLNRIALVLDSFDRFPFHPAARRRLARQHASRDIERLPQNVRDDLNWPPRASLDDQPDGNSRVKHHEN